MIYLFAGNDTKKKRSAYEKFAQSMNKLSSFTFIKNDFDQVAVTSLFSGQGLFFEKCVVYFENVFDNEDHKDFCYAHLNEMGESENIFVFLEIKLLKSESDAFKKARAEINVFEMPKEKLEKYDNFILANDFGARDKLNLWIHYRRAVDLGVRLEELSGILFWKAKDMILKKNFSKFKEYELKNFAQKISYLLPESRTIGKEDEIAFEQFLLEIL